MAAKRANPKDTPDVSAGYAAPEMNAGLTFGTLGSRGLRQWSGWVREEFLPQLIGRQAARSYREMLDNCSTVGAINFAIQQSMRQCAWRAEAPLDTPQARQYREFAESLKDDMSHTWSDFIAESLTMLPYGFAPHEIVYKRRQGRRSSGSQSGKGAAPSKFDDGLIGWARLPIRGQDTVLKWFFDDEGQVTGLTQQPWMGGLIDIPMEKVLLFRPRAHKNNPEGYSILRTAYRPWYFLKRLEEQEAVMLERFSGFPVITVPNALLDQAKVDAGAKATLAEYQKIVRNVRVDEQMGLILPSDTYQNADGSISNVPQYKFELVAPTGNRAALSADTSIERYKLDIMTSVLADFLMLGHSSSSKGSQTLGEAKIDLFFQAIEGWLESNADVLNDHGLARLWDLNGFDPDLMPRFVPDMPQRIDLDGLSNFVLRLAQAGARLFPDDDLENYLRDVANLPELTGKNLSQLANTNGPEDTGVEVQKHVAGMLARRLTRQGYLVPKSGRRKAGKTYR